MAGYIVAVLLDVVSVQQVLGQLKVLFLLQH